MGRKVHIPHSWMISPHIEHINLLVPETGVQNQLECKSRHTKIGVLRPPRHGDGVISARSWAASASSKRDVTDIARGYPLETCFLSCRKTTWHLGSQ